MSSQISSPPHSNVIPNVVDENNHDDAAVVPESAVSLSWLDTECGQYYVDKLFEALATSFKTQVIIKQAERFFNKGLTKESIKTKLTTELKYGFGG